MKFVINVNNQVYVKTIEFNLLQSFYIIAYSTCTVGYLNLRLNLLSIIKEKSSFLFLIPGASITMNSKIFAKSNTLANYIIHQLFELLCHLY